jgi:hypothetical protein
MAARIIELNREESVACQLLTAHSAAVIFAIRFVFSGSCHIQNFKPDGFKRALPMGVVYTLPPHRDVPRLGKLQAVVIRPL